MKHGSLFSGIGGFDLAAEWMGWENVFHCEIEPFPRRVLNHYWPNSKSYEDIKTTDFTIWNGKIDILTGGFPCQPYSHAGKRLGKEDERHLWPEMLRAIREIQPRFIVGENVSGIVSWNGGMVFEEVQTDLEAEGYEVQAVILPACAKGAPHRRDRVWFVAHSTSNTFRNVIRNERQEPQKIQEKRPYEHITTTNSKSSSSEGELQQRQGEGESGRCYSKRNATNSKNERLQRSKNKRSVTGSWEEREKQFTGRVRPNWQNFPTQSPICSGNDGFSTKLDGITFPKWRNESIKGAGNAIVPQVAYEIFKVINTLKNY